MWDFAVWMCKPYLVDATVWCFMSKATSNSVDESNCLFAVLCQI